MTFSNKLLGDGFMISSKEEVVCSPCDGVLTMVFPTKHAFGIKIDEDNEVLVHIGIDTVELKGEGFEQLVEENKIIKKGMPIIKYDLNKIEEKGYDTSVIVILVGKQNINKNHINEFVNKSNVIIGD